MTTNDGQLSANPARHTASSRRATPLRHPPSSPNPTCVVKLQAILSPTAPHPTSQPKALRRHKTVPPRGKPIAYSCGADRPKTRLSVDRAPSLHRRVFVIDTCMEALHPIGYVCNSSVPFRNPRGLALACPCMCLRTERRHRPAGTSIVITCSARAFSSHKYAAKSRRRFCLQ